MLGHVDAVVEVRVDHRGVDGEARALEAHHRNARGARVADRAGRHGRVDDPDHDRIEPGVGRGPDGPLRLRPPVLVREVGVSDPQLDAPVSQPALQAMTNRIDCGVRAVGHRADIQSAHR